MEPATDRQKERLSELDVEFDEDISKEEAAEILRSMLPKHQIKLNLPDNCLVEMSEVKAGEM